ncbi:hypothetical protein RDG74_004013 [Vibrio vulnificus]|nr:hypothetical protein [Vibrio vulnificus]
MKMNKFKLAPLAIAVLLTGCDQEWPDLDNPGIPPVVPVGEQVASFDDPTITGDCEDATSCWAGWNVIQSVNADDDAFLIGTAKVLVTTPAGGWEGAKIGNWEDKYNGTSLIQTIGQTENRITDALTGELVSPPILIENNYLQLQVAGGNYSILAKEGMTGVQVEILPVGATSSYLLSEPAEVIGWSSGENSNNFAWKAFDVSAFNDGTRYARIRVVDANTGGWGQTIVDNVYRSDELVREVEVIDKKMIGSFDLAPVNQTAPGWTSTFTADVVGNTEGNPQMIGQAVNTCIAGACDATTGTLTSDAFEIEQDFINFATIGGGNDGQQVFVKLSVDLDGNGTFTEQRSESPNTCGAWSEPVWVSWNVAEFKGKQAQVEIIDNETNGCGFIVVDQIHQSKVTQ